MAAAAARASTYYYMYTMARRRVCFDGLRLRDPENMRSTLSFGNQELCSLLARHILSPERFDHICLFHPAIAANFVITDHG